jgi:hypothetical protein
MNTESIEEKMKKDPLFAEKVECCTTGHDLLLLTREYGIPDQEAEELIRLLPE